MEYRTTELFFLKKGTNRLLYHSFIHILNTTQALYVNLLVMLTASFLIKLRKSIFTNMLSRRQRGGIIFLKVSPKSARPLFTSEMTLGIAEVDV